MVLCSEKRLETDAGWKLWIVACATSLRIKKLRSKVRVMCSEKRVETDPGWKLWIVVCAPSNCDVREITTPWRIYKPGSGVPYLVSRLKRNTPFKERGKRAQFIQITCLGAFILY
jgi:hypothetical protein